ncbi:MAG: Hpt domain-containing protein [Gammaproteobacteria bacterium]|nr:Hpt domain-containing protein [Gammaproteobacteria bacterium]
MSDIKTVQDKLILLKEKYINSLADKITDLFHEWDICKDSKTLTNSSFVSQLHKLAGSAGMYEFFELGEKARSLELTAIEFKPPLPDEVIQEIDTSLKQLKEMVADICQ